MSDASFAFDYERAPAVQVKPLHDIGVPLGIHFGMPDEDYHALPALSASGIRKLLISPTDFWYSTAWLNPNYEPEESPAMELGTAYHCRILEGREVFGQRYAAALDIADHPNVLHTVEDIKAACGLHIPPRGKTPKNKAQWIAFCRECNPAAVFADELHEAHRLAHEGKTLLPAKLINKIQIAAAMIERHGQLSKAFTGGYPEVVILWVDEEHGVPCKARLDYLKERVTVDLKSFSNPLGKPIDRAVASAMASGKNHIQAAFYDEAVEAARRMLRVHGPKVAHGDFDAEWLERFAEGDDQRFLFVYSSTGVAPLARGYEFPKGTVFDIGRLTVRDAKHKYVECMERFGHDPWVDMTDIRAFDDTEFPIFMTEA